MRVLVLLAALLLSSSPASADGIDGTRRWSGDTVCVESHVKKVWGVKAAIKEWNKAAGPKYVLADDCFGAGVRVQTSSAKPGYAGWTQLEWSGDDVLVAGWITFYPGEFGQLRGKQLKCFRAHTVAHEFGHALGLRHYPHSHSGSVMSYLDPMKRCGKLSHHDKADLAALYAV